MVVMVEAPLVPLTAMAVLLEDLTLSQLEMDIVVLEAQMEVALEVQTQVTPALEAEEDPLEVQVEEEEDPLVVDAEAPQLAMGTTAQEGPVEDLVDHLEEEEVPKVPAVVTLVPLEVVVEAVLEVAL